MRIRICFLFILVVACQSETDWSSLEVETEVVLKLPEAAVWGNLKSFTGLNAAAPDLFISEFVFEEDERLHRQVLLADQILLVDQIQSINDSDQILRYATVQTNLPVKDLIHQISVEPMSPDAGCVVKWKSELNVQNLNKNIISSKLQGIHETYLFSLQELGEELDLLLEDDAF